LSQYSNVTSSSFYIPDNLIVSNFLMLEIPQQTNKIFI